jgi:pimeloyl-ACP methyl ester carboxylesterase
MPPVEGVAHRTVNVDGYDLHVAEAGSGFPVMLVHGWPQHWYSWRHVIPALAEHFRVIVPDIRGMGWSEGPGPAATRDQYSLERLAADAVELLDALSLERAHFVGHDWGCLIGYRALLSHPGRIGRAVLLGGVHAWAAPSAPRLYVRPWHIYAYAAVGYRLPHRLGVPRRALETWRHAGAFGADELDTYLQRIDTPSAGGATRAFDRNVVTREIPYFVRHYRSLRVDAPVLHLNGAEDPLTVGLARSYREYAPRMTFETVPGCGHFIPEERPRELVERVLPFLREGDAAAEHTASGAVAGA